MHLVRYFNFPIFIFFSLHSTPILLPTKQYQLLQANNIYSHWQWSWQDLQLQNSTWGDFNQRISPSSDFQHHYLSLSLLAMGNGVSMGNDYGWVSLCGFVQCVMVVQNPFFCNSLGNFLMDLWSCGDLFVEFCKISAHIGWSSQGQPSSTLVKKIRIFFCHGFL